MSTLTHREYRGPFMDIFDWLESPWTVLRPGRQPADAAGGLHP